MGVAVSSSHVVSDAPSFSGGGVLTLCPCSRVGSLLQETVLHKLLQQGSFKNCSSMGLPHGVQSLRNRLLRHASPTRSQALPVNLFQRGLLSLHGATGPTSSLLQHRLRTGSQPPSGTHLLRRGVLHGLQVDICSTIDLHRLQGDSLPHHGLLHGLQGNVCSGAWSTSSPSSFTDFGVCRVVSLTYSQSCLMLQLCRVFSPFSDYVITEVLPPSLMGLALASSGSILEPAVIGSIGRGGSFQRLLTEATPVAPPLLNLAMQTQYRHMHCKRTKEMMNGYLQNKKQFGSTEATRPVEN